MDYLELILIAIGLSFDTFAVSVAAGAVRSRILFKEAIKIAFVMAIFQGVFPLLGFYIGTSFVDIVKSFDHWIAFLLLGILGGRMIWSGLKMAPGIQSGNISRFPVLLTLALGTSIDAFAVGIGFAFLEVQIILASVVIGGITFMASMTAIRLGKAAGPRLGARAEIAGGLILIIIGTKILLEHLSVAAV